MAKTLQDLLHHTMKDMNFAERAILKALPNMIEAASDTGLKSALKAHMKETETHVARLEKAFSVAGVKAGSEPCDAIQGILKEGEGVLKDFGGTKAADAAIIASCQAVEHYEITRYGTMHAWAVEIENDKLAELFETTLAEEYAADDTLTELAEGGLNQSAEAKARRAKARMR
jgi:ferritin-like metal-binding protein YciE